MESEVQRNNGGFPGTPNRKGRPVGTPTATVKDLKQILQWRLLGYTHEEMATKLNRPTRFVSRVLAKHDLEIKARLEGDIVQEKVRQVQVLDYVVQESVRAFVVSKGESPDLSPPAPVESPRRAPVVRPGDPAYLKEMRAALSDQREIFGIGQTVTENNFNLAQVTAIAEQIALEHQQEPDAQDEPEDAEP